MNEQEAGAGVAVAEPIDSAHPSDVEAIVVSEHIVGPPGPSEWRAMREQALVICQTDFVPTEMRGSPEKVLAAILTGRELGLGPMASLQGIRIQDGKPAYDAELMRALVRRRGHQIKATVKTHQRCVVWGRRCDTGEEAEVEWTLDDAKIANLIDEIKDDGLPKARSRNDKPLPWEQYPRRLLFARATSELVGDLFADVLVGGSYTPEELGSPQDWDEPVDPEAQARVVETARLVGLIDAAIADERITPDQAQKAASAHGLRTRSDVTSASPDVLRSLIETLGIDQVGDGSQAPAGEPEEPVEGDVVDEPAAEPEKPAEPAPASKDDPLADRILAALASVPWEPTDEEKESSGNAVEERTLLIQTAAELIGELGWSEKDTRKALGMEARSSVPAVVAHWRLAELRAQVDVIEQAKVKADEEGS